MQATDTEKALRGQVRSHNSVVLMSSGLALLFSLVGWALLYGASYWVTMIVVTLAHNGEGSVPEMFNVVFLGSAAVLMLAARFDQWMFPSERTPDERPPVEHLADLLFFVPRFTMSSWQSLGALVWLSRRDLPAAAGLMEHFKSGARLSLQELPAKFPDEGRMRHVLEMLMLMGLIDQRRDGGMTWLYLGALAPECFRDSTVTLPAPKDPLASVPYVKIRRRVRLLRPPDEGSTEA
jgi:hypothetical protein